MPPTTVLPLIVTRQRGVFKRLDRAILKNDMGVSEIVEVDCVLAPVRLPSNE